MDDVASVRLFFAAGPNFFRVLALMLAREDARAASLQNSIGD
jgi:hypothetical protein